MPANPHYVCVADGVIMDVANRNPEYLEVINSGMFCICDSSFVPLYIRLIYGEKKEQYIRKRDLPGPGGKPPVQDGFYGNKTKRA